MSTGLLWNILIFYAILIGINLPAPLLGIEFESGEKSPLWYAPPGWVIPVVWFVLFALLGTARSEIQKNKPDTSEADLLLFGLAFLCASYAYYTLGLSKITGVSPLWFGLFGNMLVILFCIFVCIRIKTISPLATGLIFPVAIWTFYATLIVIGEMKNKALI